MAWPLSQDYNEAIQNPQTSFGDAELRGGQAVTNALGVPMPRSGNFADVYEFHGASGQKWAVKCFTRQIPGLQERYSEISKHLLQAKLPFTVDFTYLEKGIRIRGVHYPVLKMQWVEGFLLNEFVRNNLDKPGRLDALGQIWLRMAKRLGGADIAHADLQHGNVILVQGSKSSSLAVKLIDYDGMWVPALKQKKSGESGHPAYQHPLRLQQGTYSADVDRLPILAIACALRCLAVGGKTLWNKYDNGDNMLFREADLRNPQGSALFKELWNLSDPAAHDLTGYLALALSVGLDKAPLLPDLYNGDQPQALTAAQEKQATTILGPGAAVNRAVSPPKRRVTSLAARTKTAQPEAASASDWDFTSDVAPSSIIRRKAKRGANRKILLGAAAAGVLFLVFELIWLWPKESPVERVVAKNNAVPVEEEIPEQSNPAPVVPDVVEEKPPKKTPIAPPEPIAEAKAAIPNVGIPAEIPAQVSTPDYSGLAKNVELDLGGAKLKMVRIDPGKFMMGSPDDEVGRQGNEGPLHEVEITKPFYMGVHEVTRGQFRAFVDATGYKTDAEADGKGGEGFDAALNRYAGGYKPMFSWRFVGFDQTDDHPVINVSWNDAVAFCAWLSQKEGKSVDLPREAEWEYSCRAGSRARFISGDSEQSVDGFANVRDRNLQIVLRDNIAIFDIDDRYPFTAPVGRFKPNAWGLYDMLGNAFEWCKDFADINYYKYSPRADPPGPAQGNSHIARGASFNTPPNGSRVAFRRGHPANSRSFAGGFRIVVRLGPLVPEVDKEAIAVKDDSKGKFDPVKLVSLPKHMELDVGNSKLKLVRIDPGKFSMGSPKTEIGRNNDEELHDVEITQPFYMGVCEVTKGQFRTFVEAEQYKAVRWQKTLYQQTDEHPVVNVNWHEAMAFCAWLSRKEGVTVDLPTEAEWEYACRAGTKTRYFPGDADVSIKRHANIADQAFSVGAPKGFPNINFNDGYRYTAPVGRFQENAWGLHDMHGNVWEWCRDWYDKDYYKISPRIDPRGPSEGSLRVARGGCWNSPPNAYRSAVRFGHAPGAAGDGDGFRVVVRPARISGFVSIFNGKDLTGFEGDPSLWNVEDGIIKGSTVGISLKAGPYFLTWSGKVDDFELKGKFRLDGSNGNSGIQYRSKQVVKNGSPSVTGYQADMALSTIFSGSLWETGGRQYLARTGQKIIIDANGTKREAGSLGTSASIFGDKFRPMDWHDFHIIAKGNHLQHFIDGKQTIDVIDNQENARALAGILAFELNPNTTAYFKDIQLKRLTSESIVAQPASQAPVVIKEFRQLAGHESEVHAVVFTPDGRFVYSGDSNSVRRWEVDTGAEVQNLESKFKIFSLSVAPDGKKLAGGGGGMVAVWDLVQKNATARALVNSQVSIPVLFLHSGKKLVSAVPKNGAGIWDVANFNAGVPLPLEKTPSRVMSLAVSANGRLLAYGGYGGQIHIWNVAGDIPSAVVDFNIPSALIEALAFSPDGKTLAVGYSQNGTWALPGNVQFWSTKDGKLLGSFLAHEGGMVRSLAYTKDGKTLLTASYDQTIKLWDLKNDKATIKATMNGHTGPIWGIALSPDGRYLASASSDKTVRLWRMADAEAAAKKR